MNSKGQVIFLGLMIGVVVILLALALAPAVRESVDSVRNETTIEGFQGLNCTNPAITNFDRATCISADLTIFHFVAGLIFIGGAIITARVLA